MKLDLLSQSPGRPAVVRLFDYRQGEVGQLCRACRGLASGRVGEFVVHRQPWIEVQGGCEMVWRAAGEDEGIQLLSDNMVELSLAEEGWLAVEAKLAVFARGEQGFDWLAMGQEVNLLISPDGQW